jgi:hypothetical protein
VRVGVEIDIVAVAAIALVGVIAGIVNTVVGAGTSIVLPLLILLGVPAQIANGTNRVCVAFQTGAAALTLHGRTGADWRSTIAPVVASMAGSLPGAVIATEIDPAIFEDLLGWLLLAGIATLFLRRSAPAGADAPLSAAGDASPAPARPLRPLGLAVTFLFGIYGGFVGAGIGVLYMLYLPPLLGITLGRMVHVKTWMVLALSVVSGAWYLARGQVDGAVAAALLPSYVLGGYLGARVALRSGEAWIRRAVAAVAALLAIAVIAGVD